MDVLMCGGGAVQSGVMWASLAPSMAIPTLNKARSSMLSHDAAILFKSVRPKFSLREGEITI
jgi:hypothetical protein